LKIVTEGNRIDVIHKLYFLPLRVPKSFEAAKVEANFSSEQRVLTMLIPLNRLEDYDRNDANDQTEDMTSLQNFRPQLDIECDQLYDVL